MKAIAEWLTLIQLAAHDATMAIPVSIDYSELTDEEEGIVYTVLRAYL